MVKDQNWFAISIYFFMSVVDIFVGVVNRPKWIPLSSQTILTPSHKFLVLVYILLLLFI